MPIIKKAQTHAKKTAKRKTTYNTNGREKYSKFYVNNTSVQVIVKLIIILLIVRTIRIARSITGVTNFPSQTVH